MEIDSNSNDSGPCVVLERLGHLDVPQEYRTKGGLVEFVRSDRGKIPDLVSAILPTDREVAGELKETRPRFRRPPVIASVKRMYRESMEWLQWLMFEDDPDVSMRNLATLNVDQRGVCGAVWKHNDIAYRCRTCENDPTCAICVACFQNGDHTNHDYSIIYTGGGCCDCGDDTAWKREGFCSKHKGSEQIQPLPENQADSIKPVLDVLFSYWKNRLLAAESSFQKDIGSSNALFEIQKRPNELTYVVVEMLLEFCSCSESLLSFVSRRIICTDDLLNVLVRAERYLHQEVFKKLHVLLLKLIADPSFKMEFARAFVRYYPVVISDMVKQGRDNAFKKSPLINTFSVQIFTIPTLTPLLVKEMDLLSMLLGCLGKLFAYCAGKDGVLQVTKWGRLSDTCRRVMEDLKFVMSHAAVSKYATLERKDLARSWLMLLTFARGMNPLKREIGSHVEEENDDMNMFFDLGNSIGVIHSLLVEGVFSACSDQKRHDEMVTASHGERERHAKVGRLSHEDSVCSAMTPEPEVQSLPSPAIWLIRDCLQVLEIFLIDDEGVSKFLGKVWSPSGAPSSGLSPLCGDIQSNLHLENEIEPYVGIVPEGSRIMGVSEWPDILYDVSSQHVSLHLPLHRLLSLLLERALRICYGPYTIDADYERPDIGFFSYVLGDYHPNGFSAFVMEHALRIRVFCAQVITGMWRSNGDSPLAYYEWYRSVKWSDQGLELDLFLLQCCGALAPPDSYVDRILSRFGLSGYLSLSHDRSNEYESVLVREMLTLLIQILQERRFCGFTDTESLRREIVFKLATGDVTHSQLVNSLPEDLAESDKLQEILDNVSIYSNPSTFNQGKYSLRSSCWKEVDLYHPRRHSTNLQAVEEMYSRHCGVSALTTQLPRWRKIYPPLKELAKIGTCRSTLQLISTVLYYALYHNTGSVESRAPDGVLIAALHLLSLSLDICVQQRRYSCRDCPILDLAGQDIIGISDQSLLSLLVSLMRARKHDSSGSEVGSCNISSWIASLLRKFSEIDSACKTLLQKLAPEVVGHSSGPDSMSSASADEKRKAKARERQAAILAKMKAQQSQFLSTLTSSMVDDDDEDSKSGTEATSSAAGQEVCSLCHDPNSKDPISFLIFLQKSRLSNFIDRGPLSWDQDAEMDDYSDSLRGSSPPVLLLPADRVTESARNSVLESLRARLMKNRRQILNRSSDGKGNDEGKLERLEIDMYKSIRKRLDDNTHIESQQPDAQSSRVLEENRRDYNGENIDITLDSKGGAVCVSSHHGFDGINMSSCGHAVHQGCLERYLASLRERSNRRNFFEGAHIVDLDQGEFLCPVCRRLANSVLPSSYGDLCKVSKLQTGPDTNSEIIDGHDHPLRLNKALCLVRFTSEMIENSYTIKSALLQRDAPRRPDLENVSSKLWNLYCSEEREEKCREMASTVQSLVMWDTLKYTLISKEIIARCAKTCMVPIYSTDSLYEEFKTSSGFILSLLLQAVQCTRTTNAIHVRQRFVGMKLFAESICSGISSSDSSSVYGKEGSTQNVNEAANSAEALFYKHASDPILASDPFSSLMRLLFCLPSPFILCEKSLLSLVHIFYTVSLLQTAIAYCASGHGECGVGYEESLIADIYKACRESGCNWKYFKSNYIDFSCDIKDTVRKCSFPYLRRCALLCRLLNSVSGEQFLETEKMEFTDSSQSELIELQKLEHMFKIPPIESLLRDGCLRPLARKWVQHFRKEYGEKSRKGVLCISPAVPFQLIKLPYLYQDLLQRCIKQCCASCGKVIEDPALCLLCGRLCCPIWRSCCRESGCQTHAMSCGAGTGVFLMIRQIRIILQRASRQSLWPSPYLDAFGEEDVDMRRGYPLYLNEERYAALSYMVASHGLDQSTKVLEQTMMGTFVLE